MPSRPSHAGSVSSLALTCLTSSVGDADSGLAPGLAALLPTRSVVLSLLFSGDARVLLLYLQSGDLSVAAQTLAQRFHAGAADVHLSWTLFSINM